MNNQVGSIVSHEVGSIVSHENVINARAPAPLHLLMPLAIKLITLLSQNHTLLAGKCSCSALCL